MAMIQCPECGNRISDKATSCPTCGCPAEEIKNLYRLQLVDVLDKVATQKNMAMLGLNRTQESKQGSKQDASKRGNAEQRAKKPSDTKSSGETGKTGKIVAIALVAIFMVVILMSCVSSCEEQQREERIAAMEAEKAEIEREISAYSGYTDLVLETPKLTYSYGYKTCEGVIRNTSSEERYTFVKVKAQFMDKEGNVLDSDWTYAVGSEGIDPGDSARYEIMIKSDPAMQDVRVSIMGYN